MSRNLTAAIVLVLIPTLVYAWTKREDAHGKTIIAYYASWQWYDRNHLARPSELDHSKVTRYNFAFFQPNEEGDIWGTDKWADSIVLFGEQDWAAPEGTQQYCSWDTPKGPPEPNACASRKSGTGLIELAHDAGVEVYPSIGGWTLSNSFPKLAANPTARVAFANNCVRLIEAYDFDGIDIDWEYPGYVDHNGTVEDTVNYSLFLEEIRKALDALGQKNGQTYGLTAALPCGPEIIDNIQIDVVKDYLDELNLMTYDFHGAWNKKTGVNAPLYDMKGSPNMSVHACVEIWKKGGGRSDQINIGLPFYGRSVAGSDLTGFGQNHLGTADMSTWFDDDGSPQYFNILDRLDTFKTGWDNQTFTAYAYSSTGFLSYDDERAICEKTDYAVDNQLNGFIIWEISGDVLEDGSTPLLDAMNGRLNDSTICCGDLSPAYTEKDEGDDVSPTTSATDKEEWYPDVEKCTSAAPPPSHIVMFFQTEEECCAMYYCRQPDVSWSSPTPPPISSTSTPPPMLPPRSTEECCAMYYCRPPDVTLSSSTPPPITLPTPPPVSPPTPPTIPSPTPWPMSTNPTLVTPLPFLNDVSETSEPTPNSTAEKGEWYLDVNICTTSVPPPSYVAIFFQTEEECCAMNYCSPPDVTSSSPTPPPIPRRTPQPIPRPTPPPIPSPTPWPSSNPTPVTPLPFLNDVSETSSSPTSPPTPPPVPSPTPWPSSNPTPVTPLPILNDVSETSEPSPSPSSAETILNLATSVTLITYVSETSEPTLPPLSTVTSWPTDVPTNDLSETSEPTPPPISTETSLSWPTSIPLTTYATENTDSRPQPLPAKSSSERPISQPYTTYVPQTPDLPFLLIAESAPSSSPQMLPEIPDTQVQADFLTSAEGIHGSAESRYVCGDGFDSDESNTTFEITYDYDLYTKVGMSVGEALRDVKESILSDITGRMGCHRVFWTDRRLVAGFEHIIGLTSYMQDLPDPNALGCDVQTDELTMCTPVNGGFTIFAKPGTSAGLLEQTSVSLTTMVQDSMGSGFHESEIMQKVVYIGDRESNSKALGSAPPENAHYVNKSSNKKLIGTILCLFFACFLLVCYLHEKRAKRDRRSDRYGSDEDVPLDKYNGNVLCNHRNAGWSNMAPDGDDYHAGPQRKPRTPPHTNGEDTFQVESGAGIHRTRLTSRLGNPRRWREKATSTGRHNRGSPFKMGEDEDSHSSFEKESYSRDSRDESSFEDYSDSSDSGDPSEWTGDSSEGDRVNDNEKKVPVRDGGVGHSSYNRHSYVERIPTGCNELVDTPRSFQLYGREERQRRLENARVRAAQRKSLDSRSNRD